MDRGDWDTRYAEHPWLFGADPNRFLVAEVAELAPGRALDLACGEGRNAVWLAERGWDVTAVDFSEVALARARGLAEARGVRVAWAHADLRAWAPPAGAFDLVLVLYLQLPAGERRGVLAGAAAALAPGGVCLLVAHHLDNLREGYGGPSRAEVLATEEDLAAGLPGLAVERAERVVRRVETPEGPRRAIDALVRARRTAELAG